ncbi:DUF2749 domain-containing protein [Bradyrhizobium japonicum]|uniref:DUF2749 domain-containing protein n=1 Tax=Bradyrhizobium japonicum TaxID=375 RepID=UPI0035A13837
MRPSTIIIVVIAIGACAAGAWLFLAPHTPRPGQGTASAAGDVFTPPAGLQDVRRPADETALVEKGSRGCVGLNRGSF